MHLTDPDVAGLIRERWDAAFGVALRLPSRVSQTWLAPRPGTYPAAISLQVTERVSVSTRFVPADAERRQLGRLEMKVDRLVWQVCDFTVWKAIGLAWLAAHQALLQ